MSKPMPKLLRSSCMSKTEDCLDRILVMVSTGEAVEVDVYEFRPLLREEEELERRKDVRMCERVVVIVGKDG